MRGYTYQDSFWWFLFLLLNYEENHTMGRLHLVVLNVSAKFIFLLHATDEVESDWMSSLGGLNK